MDWKNIDLTSPHERAQDVLDSYSFDTLLLEVECNMGSRVNKTLLREHFYDIITKRTAEAVGIFEDNIENILTQAKKENR